MKPIVYIFTGNTAELEDDVNKYIEEHDIDPGDIINIEHKTLWLPEHQKVLYTIMLVYKVLSYES
jgi:hypothetical protein